MFLDAVMKKNRKLVETGFSLHQRGLIAPDSYVVDLDSLLNNAENIKNSADQYGISLYFMLKQLGRNPFIAKELVRLGYPGAVVVDFKEAQVMMKNKIPIGNIGHLVQTPKQILKDVIAYGCEIITVYSLDKIKEVNEAARQLNIVQPIMLRIVETDDIVYSGQSAGFSLEHLRMVLPEIQKMSHVCIEGVTSFPCFLYDDTMQKTNPTNNLFSVLKAKEFLVSAGIQIKQLNTPSATCVSTLPLLAQYQATHGEPGHGLTGTTPAHASGECTEIPSVIYVSEVSHNFDNKSYCYGGGHYRRSHMHSALVGTNISDSRLVSVIPPTLESIDYHLGLSEPCHISDTCIMAFRFQIFVTRSDVVLVCGIASGKPEIVGIYDALGNKK